MPVNFSIKNVPDDLADALRRRAEENHRSIQGELMAILESALARPELTPGEVVAQVRALGLSTPPDAVAMIRADRDSR
jgi:plasmid stability protein